MSAVLIAPEREQMTDPEHLWTLFQQLYGRDSGQTDWGVPKDHTTVDDDTRYAHVLRNLGTGGALRVVDSSGNNQLLVSDGGVNVTALTTSGAMQVGTDLTVLGNTTLGNNTAVDTVTINAAVTANGNVTLGDAAGDTLTVNATATFQAPLTANGTFSTTATTNLGNGNADAITVIGVSTFRNAANTATQMFVDAANHRVHVGTATQLSGATGSMLEVTGLTYLTPSVAGEVALSIWRSPAAAAGWGIGVTATDQLKFTDNGGQGIATIGDTSSAFQLEITGAANITTDATIGDDLTVTGDTSTGRLVVGGTTFSGLEELRVVGQTRLEGALVVTTGGIDATGTVAVTGAFSASLSSSFGAGLSITGGLSVLTGAITSHAVAGTPAANALYTNNTPKGWVYANTSGGINNSFNVSSVTDNGTGDWSVNWDRDFSSASYCAVATMKVDTARIATIANSSFAAGVTRVLSFSDTGAASDPNEFMCMAMGVQ